VLYACSVNSKEAAASLPAILLVYELLFDRKELRGVVVTGLVGLVFLWSRFTSPNLMLGHPDYTPLLTVGRYLESTAVYLSGMVGRVGLWTPASAACLLVAMLVLAAALRDRLLLFATALVVIGAAPIAFVTPRGTASYYIPILGYALYAAILLVRMMPRAPALAWQSALFLAVFLPVAWLGQKYAAVVREPYWKEWQRIQITASEYRAHPEWFGPGKSMLIVSDNFEEFPWASTFLAYLIGGQRSMQIHKLAELKQRPSKEEIAEYTTIIGFREGRYVEVE
jgi:hypothetical protein